MNKNEDGRKVTQENMAYLLVAVLFIATLYTDYLKEDEVPEKPGFLSYFLALLSAGLLHFASNEQQFRPLITSI